MKRLFSSLFVAFFAATAMGDDIRIGTMELPLMFEGNAPTGPVFDFVTNEVGAGRLRRTVSAFGFLWFRDESPPKRASTAHADTDARRNGIGSGFRDGRIG